MGTLRLVCFELAGQELALPIDDVRETVPLQPITRLFLVPAALAGVFSLRGDIVPALDLGILLGLGRTLAGADSRIVVIASGSGAGASVAGVVVDRLRDLRVLDGDAALEPPPASLPAEISALLRGVTHTETGSVRVLDVGAILGAEPLRVLARTHTDTVTA
jgi:purine-binding chemotaxis protein CheW